MTTRPAPSRSVVDACQRALGLALRRETDAAFDLLETTTAATGALADTSAENTDEALRYVADALYLVARWTGDYSRGENNLGRLLKRTDDPNTRGWIAVRMSYFSRPEDITELTSAALGDFTAAGDDAGQAMSMLSVTFPRGDLLPSAKFRLGLVDAAEEVGERLVDPVIVARALNVRAALLTYMGEVEDAVSAYRKVWETFHVGSPLLSSEAASAVLNHCLSLLSWGRFDEVDDVLGRARYIVTGPRIRDWFNVVRATEMVYHGRYRAVLGLADSMTEVSEEVAPLVTVLRVTAGLEISATVPDLDLEAEAAFLEARSMQLGALARVTQADLRAVRGEPRPHRDLGPALRRLVPSRPRFGWDGMAVTLAELAPDEARETLEDMWDFWPAGPRPAVQRLFAETLLRRHAQYPSFLEVADRFEANGEFQPAARALVHASRVAPSGGESLLAHKRAIDLYAQVDADRSLATLLRARRIRREPGAPTIPESQRHALNPGLTAREREVTELAAEGLTGREIAARLGISLGTVRNHLQHARDKLGGLPKRDFTQFR